MVIVVNFKGISLCAFFVCCACISVLLKSCLDERRKMNNNINLNNIKFWGPWNAYNCANIITEEFFNQLTF